MYLDIRSTKSHKYLSFRFFCFFFVSLVVSSSLSSVQKTLMGSETEGAW